ncbi:unnamed protein product [Rhizoctonia solani]|uniref:CHAT domain-containing protein n=1 Tax=Rhizoctonia solani TaxID=456999 RepID=A0A8H3B685_9AGAM|nr:unnamed protein product [Rhizoctonia solani]
MDLGSRSPMDTTMSPGSRSRATLMGLVEENRDNTQDASENTPEAETPEKLHLNIDDDRSVEDPNGPGQSQVVQLPANELELLKSGMVGLLLTQGSPYKERYQRLGKLTDLDKVIECDTLALGLTANNDLAKDLHANLGVSYCYRYERLGELADLDKAIECKAHALALTSDEDPDISDRNAYLAASYYNRYERLGELSDLEKAIECHTRALELTPDGHPGTADRYTSLGMFYIDRYRHLGEPADIEKAFEYHSRALVLTPNGHPDMSTRHANLGVSYTLRYQRLGGLADLDKAMECDIRALALTPDGHPYMLRRHFNLGAAYSDRYQRLGELVDIEKAIECHSRALLLTSNGHPDMPHMHASLGMSYNHRYQRLGDLADLDKAIECDTRALALTPDRHPDLLPRLASLGESYRDRYQRLGELADIEKAVECHSRALALTPDGHRDMPRRHDSLGLSYICRYRRLDELADLEKSIECHSRALALTPNGHPDMPHLHSSLGQCYSDRYRRLDELEDLDKAIEHYTHALGLTPDDHPHISNRHASLGVAYDDRYECLGELADLDKAIEFHTRGLALTPTGHPKLTRQYRNYAMSLLQRYKHTDQSAYLADCWEAFRKASQDFTGTPQDRFRHALQWASTASEQFFCDSIEPYQTAIDLLPQFIWLGATASQRYQDLLTAKNLATNACFEAILCSDHSLALEWLEHARCVVWNQSLMLRLPLDQLHSSYPDVATQLRSVATQLDSSSFQPQPVLTALSDSISAEQVGQQRRRLATEYQNLLAQTRQLPGFETFLQPSKASELMGAVRGGPIVVINCHWFQCDALVIVPGNDKVGHLELPNFTENKARQAHSELEGSLRRKGIRQRGVKVRPQPGYEDGIESVLSILWSGIVKPVLDHLGYIVDTPNQPLPHITWCPTGPLSFLPFHAAGDYSQPQSQIYNYAVSSYTPTLSALLVSTPRAFNQDCRILAIGQANTPDLKPLPGTIKELSHVKTQTHDKAQYSQLTGDQATTAAVLDAMEQHDWVHLACHAHNRDLRMGLRNDVPKQSLPHITWCPTGPLSFLPLHAAGDYSQPQSQIYNYAVSSYIPTLSALLVSTPRAFNQDCRILAIGQANTPNLKPLPGTIKELSHVKTQTHNKAQYSQLTGDQATTAAVLDAMEQYDWVHLACHAHQNVNDPTQSGFFLHDGTLTLSTINQRSFKNKGLAFLSACQTATGDENLPDEAIHLASGMLMAGYPSVIATMWSVDDRDAPYVADKVYAQLMKDGKLGNGEAGRALHHAVAGLRAKVGEKDFGRWVPYIHIGS